MSLKVEVIADGRMNGCEFLQTSFEPEPGHGSLSSPKGAISKFRDVKTLQKFASIHASIHNHFNLERHLTPRETFKQNHAVAMAEWRQLAA